MPADGVIVEGETGVDESMLTGESLPVSKKPGDKIIGGSINQSGAVKAKVSDTGDKTYLSKVIKLVQTHKRRSLTLKSWRIKQRFG